MYNLEDLRFYHMPKVANDDSNLFSSLDSPLVFAIEQELTLDEKVAFIDEMRDGIATYMLGIIALWGQEKELLPKRSGNINTSSQQAWLRRNDPRESISRDSYSLGRYFMFNRGYYLIAGTSYRHGRIEEGDVHVVHQWFHDLCTELANAEARYFRARDPYHIKLERLYAYIDRYDVTFNSEVLEHVRWNSRSIEILHEDLDKYIEAYEQLEVLVNNIGNQLASEVVQKSVEITNGN